MASTKSKRMYQNVGGRSALSQRSSLHFLTFSTFEISQALWNALPSVGILGSTSNQDLVHVPCPPKKGKEGKMQSSKARAAGSNILILNEMPALAHNRKRGAAAVWSVLGGKW